MEYVCITDAHFGARGDLVGDLGEAEVLIDVLDELREGFAFGENLVFRAEDVAVVLGEAANTHHAVERAGGFVAVALAEFAEAERQITVAAQRAVEDLDVARAVHRLEG